MKKIIMFDLDGTLLNTSTGVEEAVRIMLSKNNLKPNVPLKKFVGPPLYESLMKYCNLSKEDAVLLTNEFRAIYKDKTLFKAEIYEGIIDCLKKLSAYFILTVVTNKSHDNAVSIINHFMLSKYFSEVIGTDLDCKLHKSDLINQVLNNFNIKKSDCLYIGDSKSDLMAAQISQVDFLGVSYGFGFKPNETECLLFSSPNLLYEYIINKYLSN